MTAGNNYRGDGSEGGNHGLRSRVAQPRLANGSNDVCTDWTHEPGSRLCRDLRPAPADDTLRAARRCVLFAGLRTISRVAPPAPAIRPDDPLVARTPSDRISRQDRRHLHGRPVDLVLVLSARSTLGPHRSHHRSDRSDVYPVTSYNSQFQLTRFPDFLT